MRAPFIYDTNSVEHCLSRVWVNKDTEEFCVVIYTGETTAYKIMGNPAAKSVSIFKSDSTEDIYVAAAENFYTALAYVTAMKGKE